MILRTTFLLLSCIFCAHAALESDIVYTSVAGIELKMDLARPSGTGPFPAIVCLHGGGWSMGSRRSFHKMLEQFAAEGFVAAAIQYRLAPATRYPAQIEDTRAALRFLRNKAARWNIDASKMVLLGASAGAHLAMLTAFLDARTPEAVQAVVDISGPTDLRDWRMGPEAERTLQQTTGLTSDRLLSDLLGPADRSDALYSQASPVTHASKQIPPVLIFHWKEDRAVAMTQVERLVAELQRLGARHHLIWFEGKGHALNGPGVEQIVPNSVQFLTALFARR